MRLVFHPKVYSDIDQIMEHYERVATPRLAADFYAELRLFMVGAAKRPESFGIRERDILRGGLGSAWGQVSRINKPDDRLPTILQLPILLQP